MHPLASGVKELHLQGMVGVLGADGPDAGPVPRPPTHTHAHTLDMKHQPIRTLYVHTALHNKNTLHTKHTSVTTAVLSPANVI